MILFYIECCRSILSSCLLAAKTHPLLVKPQVLGLSLLVHLHDQTPGRSVDGPVTFDRCSSFGLQGWAVSYVDDHFPKQIETVTKKLDGQIGWNDPCCDHAELILPDFLQQVSLVHV